MIPLKLTRIIHRNQRRPRKIVRRKFKMFDTLLQLDARNSRSCARILAAKNSAGTAPLLDTENKTEAAPIVVSSAQFRLAVTTRGLNVGDNSGFVDEWGDSIDRLQPSFDNALAGHGFINSAVRKNYGNVRILRAREPAYQRGPKPPASIKIESHTTLRRQSQS